MPDDKRPKRPRDINQLAYQLVQEATGQCSPPATPSTPVKNPAAVALGRLGASKGGTARAAKLPAKKRQEIARTAAAARWKKGGPENP